jgi:glycolate oxidase iron-sulfur subunit
LLSEGSEDDVEQHDVMAGHEKMNKLDAEGINRCVQCGICLPHCPTYIETWRETSSPRGRLRLMREVNAGKLDVLSPGFTAQMEQCLGCRACEAACPSGVPYGLLLEEARSLIAETRSTYHMMPLFDPSHAFASLFGNVDRLRRFLRMVRIYQRSGGQTVARESGILHILGLAGAESLLPPIPPAFFDARDITVTPKIQDARPSVAFLAGCVMSTIFAPTDYATVRVLTALGWPVIIPSAQTCCGALHAHTGDLQGARELAKRNIIAFESADADFIVNNAAGCGAALHDYATLFKDDPEWSKRATDFSGRVRDISELLAGHITKDQIGLFHPLSLRVTYQDACHLAHAQRITTAPRQLLEMIPALTLVEMDEAALCCGSAGSYTVTQPEMAGNLRARKLANIHSTNADIVVTANPGCHMHLRAGLHEVGSSAGIIHIVDLLDASLRGLAPDDVVAQARK